MHCVKTTNVKWNRVTIPALYLQTCYSVTFLNVSIGVLFFHTIYPASGKIRWSLRAPQKSSEREQINCSMFEWGCEEPWKIALKKKFQIKMADFLCICTSWNLEIFFCTSSHAIHDGQNSYRCIKRSSAAEFINFFWWWRYWANSLSHLWDVHSPSRTNVTCQLKEMSSKTFKCSSSVDRTNRDEFGHASCEFGHRVRSSFTGNDVVRPKMRPSEEPFAFAVATVVPKVQDVPNKVDGVNKISCVR